MTTTSETIRKAAIVIASLDEAAADRLLDNMPEEIASQIRWMSVELHNVSEEERQSVLDEFLRNSGRSVPAEVSGVETEFTYREPETALNVVAPVATTPPPFAFLNDAPSEMLAPFFEQEHPQVTAVVMSYLEPDRASEILRQLPARLQADVVHRITQLDEPSQAVVADIEARIKQIVSRQTLSFERRRMGMAAAQAILKASSGDQAKQLLAELRSRGSQLSDELEKHHADGSTAKVASPLARQPVPQKVPARSPAPVSPVAKPVVKQPPARTAPAPTISKPRLAPAEPPEPRFPFEDFARLDDKSLAKVLHQTGPKVVLLALCGASPAVLKRISRGLGAGDMKLLQQKIRQMQPVLISDIDHAKRTMCLAADQLLSPVSANFSSQLEAAA